MMAALNVLLVEDNELNRDMLVRRLARHGMTAVCAVDGADGVSQAQAHRPDVILMDISLPVMNGWEAIRRIRALAETHAIPIIALTAHVFLEDRTRAESAGCSAFVSKPIDMSVLVEQIHLACAKGPVA
jgi:two-component system, cell cycle response regulator DivK